MPRRWSRRWEPCWRPVRPRCRRDPPQRRQTTLSRSRLMPRRDSGSARPRPRIAWLGGTSTSNPMARGCRPAEARSRKAGASTRRTVYSATVPPAPKGRTTALPAPENGDSGPRGGPSAGTGPTRRPSFDYTRKAMPQTTPGTLTDDQVYAVVGYVLHLSGIVSADAVLDSASLAAVEMPARDRFVPDNRTGGPEIR